MTEQAETRYVDHGQNPFLNWLLGLSLLAIGLGVLLYFVGDSMGSYYDSELAARAGVLGIAGSLDMWGTLGFFMFLLGRGITWRPAPRRPALPVQATVPDDQSSPEPAAARSTAASPAATASIGRTES